MNPEITPPAKDANGEIPALIETLLATGQRLEELTGGEVDTVAGRDGRTFFLGLAQEQFRQSEADKQAAILNEIRVLIDMLPAMIWFKDTENVFLRVNKRGAAATGRQVGEIEGKSACEIFPQEAAGYYADDLEVIRSGLPKMGIVEKLSGSNGEPLWVQTDKVPVLDKDGKVTGLVVMAQDISARKRGEGELERARALFAGLVNSIDGIVWEADAASFQFTFVSERAEHILGFPPAQWLNTPDFWANQIHPADRQEAVRYCIGCTGKKEDHTFEYRMLAADGRAVWMRDIVTYVEEPGKPAVLRGLMLDITERKLSEAALGKAHRELVESSRLAGMAEVATGILHNVGNVLNSVNISASSLSDRLRKSKARSLSKVAAMLREHEAGLGDFLTNDPSGKKLPGYLTKLDERLAGEQAGALKELEELRQNIEHIKEIVAMQQSYAKVGGVKERINLVHLVEDGLRMSGEALSGHRVEIVREFENVPPMNIEKHKFLQILVNLVRNAHHACRDSDRADERVTVRVTSDGGCVRISVSDNGIGIPPENLTRIFNHGFTTRKDGHGFGLHSGALAAQEMGGRLTVHSEGHGTGATFTLELPLHTAPAL